MKVLLIGPLPPEFGGTTVLFKELVDDIKLVEDIDTFIINTNDKSSFKSNSLLRFIYILWKCLLNIFNSDVVSLHVSKPSFRLLFPFVLMLSKIVRRPIVVRKFGGDFYDAMHSFSLSSKVTLFLASKCDLVLLESKAEVSLFNDMAKHKVAKWMPNSRRQQYYPVKSVRKIESPLKLVYCGAVNIDKGVMVLVDSISNVPGVELSIYGHCDDDNLKRAIDKSPACTFYGKVDSSRIPSVIYAHDVLCLPTFYSGEGYPGVIIEAYSVGVPVISTSWKHIPEIVEHEVNGLLVEPNNISDLTDSIIRMRDNRELLKSLSLSAKESFLSFDSLNVNKQFINRLKSCLNN